MSEQEQTTGGTTDSSVVVVEQTTASRNKLPFSLANMEEEALPELHHKRSKAPAVPSVAEELKDINTQSKEKTECERAMSSEKHKHNVTKKLSSKRRGSSPETITLAPLMVDEKRSSLMAPTQPIPAQVSIASVSSDPAAKNVEGRKDEDDSITEEITEMRTPEVAKISSDWANDSGDAKRKGVSWNDKDYLEKVKLEKVGMKSQHSDLERKSSIGPCFRSAAPFGRPSGLSICLSKKSESFVVEEYNPRKSVINITVSQKCLVNKTIYRAKKVLIPPDNEQNIEIQDLPKVNFLGTMRQKMSDMGVKIKNVFA